MKRAWPGIDRIQEVKGLAATHLTDNQPIGPVSKRGFDQIANGHAEE
jgi:hypothetical protein